MMHELMASDTQPMPEHVRRHQLSRMAVALNEMMTAPKPSNDAWRILSDAINLLETLVQCGEAVHCRIGSSEKVETVAALASVVHCRIGSSEIQRACLDGAQGVHCRIGSSERARTEHQPEPLVHCRIGSSERA